MPEASAVVGRVGESGLAPGAISAVVFDSPLAQSPTN